jgi:hypothetical protein
LGNCENLSNELAPAGYVLNETTKELSQFYDDLETWHLHHYHKPHPEGPEGDDAEEVQS